MNGILPWMVCRAWRAGTRDSCSAFFPMLLLFLCPNGPASWVGSRAGSPVYYYVSLVNTFPPDRVHNVCFSYMYSFYRIHIPYILNAQCTNIRKVKLEFLDLFRNHHYHQYHHNQHQHYHHHHHNQQPTTPASSPPLLQTLYYHNHHPKGREMTNNFCKLALFVFNFVFLGKIVRKQTIFL